MKICIAVKVKSSLSMQRVLSRVLVGGDLPLGVTPDVEGPELRQGSFGTLQNIGR